MSLRVWLPLNGNIGNQGLSGNLTITNSNATVDSNGKLGSCYYFNGTTSRISCSSFSCGYPMSIAAWVKPTYVEGTLSQYWLSYNTASGGSAGQAISFGTYRANQFAIWYGGTYTILNDIVLENNIWYHVALTLSNNNLYLYINGEQVYTASHSQSHPGSTWFTVGARSNSSTGGVGDAKYFFKGYINDVRFYDHILSPKEIKEIAKGLVVHFPLSREGFGQDNLYDFSSTVSNWIGENCTRTNYQDSNYGNVLKITSNAGNSRIYRYVSNIWNTQQVYTVSFLAKTDTPNTTCNMSRSIADFSPTFSLTSDWKRYEGQIICTQNNTSGTLSFRIIQSGAIVYITKVKLELGDKVTPWTPHTGNSLYSELGLDSNIVYDISGFGYNANVDNPVDYSSDTPKYQVSTKFNGSTSLIKTTTLNLHPMLSTECTFSFWIKSNDNNDRSVYFSGYGFTINSTLTIEKTAGNKLRIYWAGNPDVNLTSFTIPDQQWCMITVSITPTTIKAYLDGVLTQTYTGTLDISKLGANTTYGIGRDSRTGATAYNGLMSDFRIYSTVLSDEDILELYNTSNISGE